MRYWWVNQNQTYAQEVTGGYMWSPKTRADGAFNHFYATMTEVEAGDIVFSFRNTRIAALGVVEGPAFESPKPREFGAVGDAWHHMGWRVPVVYTQIPEKSQIRPKDLIEELRQLLPAKYSPLRPNGDGLQSVYLAEVPGPMAHVLVQHIGKAAQEVQAQAQLVVGTSAQERHERRLLAEIERAPIPETEKRALVAARRGQGRFRQDVLSVEPRCRITGVSTEILLTASHIKPWSRCRTNAERLDRYNGLMLTPTIDRLFDRGYLTFSDDGAVALSNDLAASDAAAVGISLRTKIGPFLPEQCVYLHYHRQHVFRG